MPNQMTLRVQSPDHGTKRFQALDSDKVMEFVEKVRKDFNLGDFGWGIYQGRDKTGELRPSRSRTLSQYKLKHGDMLFLFTATSGTSSAVPMQTDSPSGDPLRSASNSVSVQEDEVDQILSKMDGRINRGRDQLCRHGPGGKCVHCVPIEPFDERYMKEADPPIKFLSFHSYIRKKTSGVDKGKFVSFENISCKIKPGCTEHPPWPGGICTKCQPSAITLNRQPYRHVDYIQFENPFIVERFLNYWRSTGNQRIGFLYGRYEHHKEMPLGIKAVVSAIYEPPQASARSSVELKPDDKEEDVNKIAAALNLVPVGWIFTDLVAEDLQKGSVKHFRGNMDSHFLSAEECIMAASLQNKHVNPCKLSPDGHFGSKFVTVVVTGDKDNQIHFEGYQVSNQCMALVGDDCLIPTKDASELGYVKESSNEQYVPDVFYKEKDSYGNEVTSLARPLPVEYLLVDMPAAFPVESMFTFPAGDGFNQFPAENREQLGEIQDFNTFSAYMKQFPPEKFLRSISDFHLIVYLATCDMLPLKNHLGELTEAVRTQDEDKGHRFSKSEEWCTVEQLLDAHGPSPSVSRQGSYVGPNASPLPPIGAAMWACKHCTLLNKPENSTCEMCSLPK